MLNLATFVSELRHPDPHYQGTFVFICAFPSLAKYFGRLYYAFTDL
jgi:hypothetical protein